jgi:hypothetical protein
MNSQEYLAPDSFVRVEPTLVDDLLATLYQAKNAKPFHALKIYLDDGRILAIREPWWLVVNLRLRFICVFEEGVRLLYFQEFEIRSVRVLNSLSWLLEEFPWHLKRLFLQPLDNIKASLEKVFRVQAAAPAQADEPQSQSIDQRKTDIFRRQDAVPFRPFVIRRVPDPTCPGMTFTVIHPSCLCFTSETSIRVQDPIRPVPLEFQLASIESILPNID